MKEKNNPAYYITSLSVEGVRCFSDKQILNLTDSEGRLKQWTVILGNNGVGKTTLLQCISALEPFKFKDDDTTYTPTSHRISITNKSNFNDSSTIKLNMEIYYDIKFGDKINSQKLLNPNVSIGTPSNSVILSNFTYWGFECPKNFLIYGYGATRLMGKKSPEEENWSDNSASLFSDDATLISADKWLKEKDYAESKAKKDEKGYFTKQFSTVKDILINILPDVTDIRIKEPTKEDSSLPVEFLTHYGWVRIEELGLGYRSMIAWMVDLTARLFKRYPDSDNPIAEPAIVLIDEIDLHLHPKWQREIMGYLSERFTKTQFIVTAHSPLIVQSATDANIVVLKRDGDHVIIDNNVKTIHGWRIDQIMASDLFGEISQRPVALEKPLKERREILSNVNLTEEDKKRLKELEEEIGDLPTGESIQDIEAMNIIHDVAKFIKEREQKAK
jgi:predicted ATP-binding protein involved in virulence